MRRTSLVLAAVAAGALAWPSPAAADPGLSVSSVRQEPGFVEFFLSGRELPDGATLSDKSIQVLASDQKLATKVTPVSAGGQAQAPQRAVVLVLDTSTAAKGAVLDATKAAASAYVDAMPVDVQVAVVTAGVPPTTVLPPTADHAKAKLAIGALAAAGGTAFYDGVRAAGDLVKAGFTERRIVLVAGSADTASATQPEDATDAVRDIPVDTVAYTADDTVTGALADLSSATHGKAYQAADADAVKSAYAKAADEFTPQVLVHVTIPAALQGKDVRLVVGATFGGSTVSTDLSVSLAAGSGAAAPLRGAYSNGLAPWLLPAVGLVIFLGILALGIVLVLPLLRVTDRRRRVAQVEQFAVRRRVVAAPVEADNKVTQAALEMSHRVMEQANVEGRLAQQLDRAGLRLRPHEWLLIRILALGCSVALLTVLIRPVGLGLFLGVVLGWGSTALFHRTRASKRLATFAEQLPDALQLIVGSLRSGFALSQAVDAMTKEFAEPLAGEFGRALGETRLGAEMEDALDRVAVRMKSQDLAFVVVAIRVQREIGGNLAEVLETTSATMRERATLHRQVRALSAEGRLSAYVLVSLPVLLLLYMLVVRGDYLLPLLTTPIGLFMTVFAILEMAVGTFWMLKTIRVEV
ncbi:type II secretion system F family protein [Hamadaea tsunoensis]|uniref:type II secretion system F family protein n=1 Tax=Hamadaea tsunoensis TaxID=53368 RepID=UPI00146F94D1|nr:type II secretion system F family protein [Hamadaea tsunoensis]